MPSTLYMEFTHILSRNSCFFSSYSCKKIQSKDVLYVTLEDGRKLCLECLQTSILDTGECQPLYHEIRDFYEGLNMKISQQVPMLLVERNALNEAIEGEKNVSLNLHACTSIKL